MGFYEYHQALGQRRIYLRGEIEIYCELFRMNANKNPWKSEYGRIQGDIPGFNCTYSIGIDYMFEKIQILNHWYTEKYSLN